MLSFGPKKPANHYLVPRATLFPTQTKVIAATAGEATYVLDGLLYHATGLSIKEHYTGTGGVSDHVFDQMPFFGYRFAPRLRDPKDRRLHLLPGQEAGPLLTGITGDSTRLIGGP